MPAVRSPVVSFVEPGSRPAAPSARGVSITIAICIFVAVFEGFDAQAAGVAGPGLALTFGLKPTVLGWFFSASTVGLIVGAAVGGRLSDLFGRKAVLIASVAVFGAMSIATAASPDVFSLMLFRVMTGAGLGGALPNLIALVSENASPTARNGLLSGLYACLPAGGGLVSAVGLISGAKTWQLVFQAGGIIPLLAVPLMILFLPESRQLAAAKAAPAGERTGFVFALFHEGRAVRTLLLFAAFFLSLLTMSVLLNWLPMLLVGRGLTRPEASLAQLSYNLAGSAAGILVGLLMDRITVRRMVLAAIAAPPVAIFFLAAAPARLGEAMVVCGLVGAAMAMTQGLLYALAPRGYATRMRGTGVGSAVAVGRVGAIVGPVLAGALMGGAAPSQRVLGVLIPIIFVSGLATLMLARRLTAAGAAADPAED